MQLRKYPVLGGNIYWLWKFLKKGFTMEKEMSNTTGDVWIRGQSNEKHIQCPFCGGETARREYDDQPDPYRVEMYCTNSDCHVRTFTVLANSHGALGRADVAALEAVDGVDDYTGAGRDGVLGVDLANLIGHWDEFRAGVMERRNRRGVRVTFEAGEAA
jgi:hypothetical protein